MIWQIVILSITALWCWCAWQAYVLGFGWRRWVLSSLESEKDAHFQSIVAACVWPIFLPAILMMRFAANPPDRVNESLVYGPWLADKIKRYKSRDRIKKLRECGWDV